MLAQRPFPDLKEILVLVGVSLLGSAAGYLLEENQKVRAGKQCAVRFDKGRLIVYLILGLVAALAVFFLLTEGRTPRATDYVWSLVVAMKGAEWLQQIGASVIKK